MSKEDNEVDWIDGMSEPARQQALILSALFLFFVFSIVGTQGIALAGLLGTFLSSKKPGNAAFFVYFERWFKQRLFPEMQERLRQELEDRSKDANRSLLGSLSDTAASFLVSSTAGLRAELSWSAFKPQMRPAFRDFWAFRTASVNLGTSNQPTFVVFIGINMEWYLSPHIKLDFDQVSVLRMIESSQ